MQKRFRAKDQNKDGVLQEGLYDDSEYTADDEIKEETRRSASFLFFFSATIKTQYAVNIANFNIHIHKPQNHNNYKTAKLQLTIQWLVLYFHNYLSLTDNFAR